MKILFFNDWTKKKEKRENGKIIILRKAEEDTSESVPRSGPLHGAKNASKRSAPPLKACGSWFLTALWIPRKPLGTARTLSTLSRGHAEPRQPRKAVCNVGGKAEINIKRELERYVVKIDPWPSVDPPVPWRAASGAIRNTPSLATNLAVKRKTRYAKRVHARVTRAIFADIR